MTSPQFTTIHAAQKRYIKQCAFWSRQCVFYITLVFLSTSCLEDSLTGYKTLQELSPDKEWVLPVPANVLPHPESIQFNPESGELSFFEQIEHKLYVFDFQKKEKRYEYFFEQEGPNGTGRYTRIGHYFHHPDTIYLFNNSNSVLFEFTEDSKVRNKIPFDPHSRGNNITFPDTRCLCPVIKYKNSIAICGLAIGFNQFEDHTKVNNLWLANTKNARVDCVLPRAEAYNQGQWGTLLKYASYTTFNPNTNQLILSMGLDHDLYVYDFATASVTQKNCPISSFPKTFKPLRKNKNDRVTKEEARHYGHTTPSYYAIMYDPYQRVYYRFGTMPQTEHQYKENAPLVPLVAVLDEEFNTINEYRMPQNSLLRYHIMFVGPDGLYVNTIPSEEGVLSFYRIKIPFVK